MIDRHGGKRGEVDPGLVCQIWAEFKRVDATPALCHVHRGCAGASADLQHVRWRRQPAGRQQVVEQRGW